MNEIKRRYFYMPLPVALIASFLIWEVRWGLGAIDDIFEMALPTIAMGLPSFPVGLIAPFMPNSINLQPYYSLIIILGYALYIGLSITAGATRSRKLLILLCVVLAINVLGCQMPQSLDAIPWK